MSSSSSSSYNYCSYPECTGSSCAHFSDWHLEGVDASETVDGRIYLGFYAFGSVQQVELYKDSGYFFLIAIGQRDGSGVINLEERNDSNVTGAVAWDGTSVDSSQSAILHCDDISSSSSSSSVDSSSSSSFSSSSTSSSSSNCCNAPYCNGASCQYFNGWTFSGMNSGNSDECRLYVGFDTLTALTQQVRVYKDEVFSEMVAIGQGTVGVISLSEANSSGLSGSVEWMGTLVEYPEYVILDCEPFSSSSSSSSSSVDSSSSSSKDSSSSSSSSIDSSSSSSSSSLLYSSSSSTSLSSGSSLSSSSTSSSSSIDSSSSSSESVGNTSSSSSSSGEFWNQAKPLRLAHTAIDGGAVNNRLAQTVTFSETTYSIGKIYCYLTEVYGGSLPFTIHFGVYTCNDEGKPKDLIKNQTLASNEMVVDGWYSFAFNISGNIPSNQFLSFVMWQEGGDENNYAMWAYDTFECDSSSSEVVDAAWISYDASDWVLEQKVVRSLRIIGDYNPYNLDDAQVETEPAELKKTQLDFGGRNTSYVETKMGANNHLTMEYPPLAISFIVDHSGSMGWNDRFENRQHIMDEMIDKISNQYPNDFLFDFISIGSKKARTNSINGQLGQVATINLDANSPDRSTYVFEISSSAYVAEGATYSHNGNIYTIAKTQNGNQAVITLGDGEPLDEGTLVKTSGLGYPSIVFSDFSSPALTSPMITCGFKNMEDNHSYIIGSISLDNSVISPTTTDNWNLYHPGSESPSLLLDDNGPDSSSAIEIQATENLFSRKNLTSGTVQRTDLSEDVNVGDVLIKIANVSIFDVGNKIDITDGENISTQHIVEEIDDSTNQITISPAAKTNIHRNSKNQGVIETSGSNYAVRLNGTTFQLLVKDSLTTRPVTFFLQSQDGFVMEWDFEAFEDWTYESLYWIDQTARLPIEVFDENGNPFADGTKVVLEVDESSLIEDIIGEEETETSLTETAGVGDTKIYVESSAGYSLGMSIDILGEEGKTQTLTIKELGTEGTKNYIEVYEPLQFAFDPSSDNVQVVVNDKKRKELSNESLVAVSLSLIDVTSVELGKTLSASLRAPYDCPVLSFSGDPTDEDEKIQFYDTLNFNKEVIRRGSIDMPTIDGEAYCRTLPVTEDILIANADKDKIAEGVLRGQPSEVYTSQIEEQTGDFKSVESLQPTGTSDQAENKDYVIDTPIFLTNGTATSAMTTTSIDVEAKQFEGFNVPGIPGSLSLQTKTYQIFPRIQEENSTGTIKAVQYFDSFDVNFANPIKIYSSKENMGLVSYFCEETETDELGCTSRLGYEEKQLYGVQAEEGAISIDYIVANRGILVQEGNLNITVYSSTVLDQEKWACNYGQQGQTAEYMNKSNPVAVETLSEVDEWRQYVQSNPNEEFLKSTEEMSESSGVSEASQQLQESYMGGYYDALNSAIGVSSGSESSYNFYSNKEAWVLGTQYETTQFSIPIVNGKAQLELPASSTVASVFIEASYPIPNTDMESIRADMAMVRNPLMMGGVSPYKIKPSGNSEDRYEIGGNVTWKDGKDGIIEDGTTVNFSMDDTAANPSASNTDDGWAGGVFLGPKDQVEFSLDEGNSQESICSPDPVSETISITINHSSGWSNTLKRKIYWMPNLNDTEVENKFFFKVEGGSQGWSDGTSQPPSSVQSDLNDGYNETYPWVGEYGIKALQGLDQPNGAARSVRAMGMTPRVQKWEDGQVVFLHNGLNQSIGNHPQVYDDLYTAPWDIEVFMDTGYYNDTNDYFYGMGLLSSPVPSETGVVYPRPVVQFEEPLGIELEVENDLVRDGGTKGVVVASVTWRGEAITNKFVVDEGSEGETTIEYPLPFVKFLAGKSIERNVSYNDEDEAQYKDYRGTLQCCLDVEKRRDAQLSSYSVEVSLSRTDTYEHNANEMHYHASEVNEDGEGTTISVFSTGSIDVADHTHTIENYEVKDSIFADNGGASVNHSHNLRSVAITEVLPTTNATLTIDVIGIVEYDPTGCERYKGAVAGVGERYPTTGNRMMFDSATFLTIEGEEVVPTEPELVLELSPLMATEAEVPTYYASETLSETVKGFNVQAKAYFTEYYEDDGMGGRTLIPQRDVSDGTRIKLNYKVFLPPKAEKKDNILVSGNGIKRHYMWILIDGVVSSEGKKTTKEMQIAIDSNLNWLPDVLPLVDSPTNDSIYLANASSQIKTMGSSALFDAIRVASRRMIALQESDPTINDYKKTIVLLTDASENKSEYSLDQAIDSVGFIDGKTQVPIIAVKLGEVYSADEIVLSKMYVDTDGYGVSSFDIEDSRVSDLIDFVLSNKKWVVGRGKYSNKVLLDRASIPKDISFGEVSIPDGTDIEFRYRTSDDGIKWGVWSVWNGYDRKHTIEEAMSSQTLYLEYEVRLVGNPEFISPTMKEDLNIRFFKQEDFVMFFKSVNIGGEESISDDNVDHGAGEGSRFVSSMHITQEADIPSTSQIQYGLVNGGINDLEDYYAINPDEHTVLLTRYNEPLITADNRNYKALNGGWTEGVEVSVYRINSYYPNGILVDPSEYASNNKNGLITFYVGQVDNDQFTVSIEVQPSFSVVCKVVNYGSKRAIIHHIGITYNISKRIPTDKNGNITHKSIDSRIS